MEDVGKSIHGDVERHRKYHAPSVMCFTSLSVQGVTAFNIRLRDCNIIQG
jgi:hypothetical protein